MRVVFFGTDDYSLEHLKALIEKGCEIVLVVSQPDKPKGRGLRSAPTPVKEYCEREGIDVVQPESLKSEGLLEMLREKRPDVGVVASFGKIIPKRVLEVPNLGCFNVHPSLLPKYRGASPIRRTLENGERKTGVTVFKMTEKLDSGPIALQREIEIGDFETYGELRKRLIDLGKILLKEFVDLLDSGRIEFTPQEEDRASYAPKISKGDLILDFSKSCVKVKDKIRAYDPDPGVVVNLRGTTVKIFQVIDLSEEISGKPGEVIDINKKGAWVGCEGGAVLIESLQFPGRRVMSFWEAKNGRKVSVGDVFERVVV